MTTDKDSNAFSTSATMSESTLRGIGLAFTNLSLAVFYLAFAFANAKSFVAEPRLSVLLIVLMETIAAVFLIIRRDPDETEHSWQTWTTTTFGTLAPTLFRPTDATADLIVGDILQVGGFALQIAALLYLSRSFGLLPAYRGIKSSGLYSWVRHPLYSAYVISFIGYWINNQSLANAAVAVFGTAFLVMRIYCEEALLLKYKDYSRYADRTRWRLIPAVW
ncbi:MAG: isoprenylcysteine carboxyl methyltransferase [Gammaproteobacteria bacterium]|nr:isoprenylcysteine carboxyl methyltransferase [Gammaproteobacteria bacterium]NNC57677.1 isoprenylcysteine carboxyl methyltransferase [Woeseiaceae bacterium]NNL49620.1 isoprenylcysteine carboxyl methyltransferase [Woeseiaceae bacterium]